MRVAWTGRILLAVIGVLTVAVAAAGWLRVRSDTRQTEDFIAMGNHAYAATAPDPLAPFRLSAHDGRVFDLAALRGGWTFMFFGFTHCPDVCPATLGAMTAIPRELRERGADTRDVRFVLVTVDPERDTPEVLGRYLASFETPFLGVTGEAAELARLSVPLGVMSEKFASQTGKGYQMDHSSSVLLIDPQGRLYGIFAAPHSARSMAEAFVAMRQRAAQGAGTGKAPA